MNNDRKKKGSHEMATNRIFSRRENRVKLIDPTIKKNYTRNKKRYNGNLPEIADEKGSNFLLCGELECIKTLKTQSSKFIKMQSIF